MTNDTTNPHATVQHVTPTISIKGRLVDNHTRCAHYHTTLDIIAIKFKCCPGYYYPCFKCHQESNTHEMERYPVSGTAEKVVVCGNCYHEMAVDEYLSSNYGCPSCQHQFNPGCKNHHHLYFS